MFGITSNTRVYVRTGRTDGRLGHNGLRALIMKMVKDDPMITGYLFCFCNAARNRIRMMWYDRSGYYIATKRVERGGELPDWATRAVLVTCVGASGTREKSPCATAVQRTPGSLESLSVPPPLDSGAESAVNTRTLNASELFIFFFRARNAHRNVCQSRAARRVTLTYSSRRVNRCPILHFRCDRSVASSYRLTPSSNRRLQLLFLHQAVHGSPVGGSHELHEWRFCPLGLPAAA